MVDSYSTNLNKILTRTSHMDAYVELLRGIEPRYLEYKSSTSPFMFQKHLSRYRESNSVIQIGSLTHHQLCFTCICGSDGTRTHNLLADNEASYTNMLRHLKLRWLLESNQQITVLETAYYTYRNQLLFCP